jgi:hypothetical protein
VIQSAKLRRVAAFTATLASLSFVSPPASNAQSPSPAPPAPPAADTTAKPAAADTTAKPAVQSAPAPGAQAAPAPAPTSTAKGKSGKASKPPKTSKPNAPKAAAAGAAGAAAKKPDAAYEERRKVDGVYAKGASWLALRFGYANRTGDLSGDGSVGFGIAYTRELSKKYAFAAGIDRDIVGHFANQIDESVPFTGEFQRIFNMKGEMRPYLGVGGGFYFRKYYRTDGEYNTTTTGGAHVSFGLTSQLDDKHVVGFETRIAWLQGRPGVVNPTFGPGEDTETIWTAKLTWALVY